MYFVNRLQSAWRFARFFAQSYPMMAYVKYLRPGILEKGRVTVITATYNRPDKLREAIESVQTQTYSNWEHVIVSDGPDRRVKALVDALGDRRIRSFHTMRLPVMGNYQRNCALRYATGEFVLYLDDDNVIFPHCLETMLSGFKSEDVGYVVCPIYYGETTKNPKPGFQYREIDLLNYMVRRSLVEKVWGQQVHAVADYLLIRDVSKISRGVFLDGIIGHHR